MLTTHTRDKVHINVTLTCVRVTTVAVVKQEVLNIMSVCLYSCLSYPVCKSHLFCTDYAVICGLLGSTIFVNITS